MSSKKFNVKLLEEKRKKFFEAVYRICKKRDLPIPKINFEGCEGEGEDQLAHYHPDENMICVSEIQLNKMDYDEIESTAAHEISHILEQNHEPAFHAQEELSNIAGFNPPSGVAIIDGGEKVEKIKEKTKIKIDKTTCNYHLCGKKKKLTICSHCKRYFCDEHINALTPGINPMNLESEEGHPCPDYLDYTEKKEKEAKERYGMALDNLLGRKYKKEYVGKRKKTFWDKIKSFFGR